MAGVDDRVIVTVILFLIFACVALLVLAAATSGTTTATRERLRRLTRPTDEGVARADGRAVLRDQRASSVGRIDALLRDNRFAQELARSLTAARIPIRLGEFVLLMALSSALTGFTVQTQSGSIVATVLAAMAGGAAPLIYVNYRKDQRMNSINDQLVDLLSMCSNSVRVGWSFLQALEQTTQELPPPVTEEIRQVLEEVSLGATPEEALLAMQRRIPSYDVELIVTAVLIQRRVGGNLAEMLNTIAHTIRGRIELLGEVRTITAESRMSQWLLVLLPVVLLGVLSALQPDYISVLFNDQRGRMILLGATCLQFMGFLALRRLARIDV